MTSDHLNRRQAMLLAFMIIFPTGIFLLPGDLVRHAGRGAPFTVLLVALLCAAVVWGMSRWGSRFGSFADVARSALGPAGCRPVLFGVWLILGMDTAIITREVGELSLHTFVGIDVPLTLLTALGLMLAGFLIVLGPTAIARSAEAMAPALTVAMFVVLVGIAPSAHLLWLMPPWPDDPSFAAPLPLMNVATWLGEPIILLVWLDLLDADARRRLRGAATSGMAAAAALIALSCAAVIAVHGVPHAGQLEVPFVALVESALNTVTVLQVVLVPLVIAGGALKTAIFYFTWCRVTSALVGRGPAGIPWQLAHLAAGGIAAIAMFTNALNLNTFLSQGLGRYLWPILAALMALPYAVSAARAAGAARAARAAAGPTPA